MFAHLLIDGAIPPARSTDSVAMVLQLMQDNYKSILAVVDSENTFLGIVKEDSLLDVYDEDASVQDYIEESQYVTADEHVLNILRNRTFIQDSIVAVVQAEREFLGIVTASSIVSFLSQDRSVEEQGGVLVLEMKSINYSMVEIAKIVESNNASIIHSFVSAGRNPDSIFVTLKINKTDLKEVMLSLERFNYDVLAVFHSSGYEEGLKERYDSLMVYLNV